MTHNLHNTEVPDGGNDLKSRSQKRMLRKSLNSISQWHDRETESTYSSFKQNGNNIFTEGSLPIKEKTQEEWKRRTSDAGKTKPKKTSSQNQHSQSVTSSPASSRRSLNAKNAKVFEDKDESKSAMIYERDKSVIVSSYSNKVSDDINEMVEQIQAIQNDISELAGRPISLAGSK